MTSLLQMMEDYTSNSENIALIEQACDACEAELRERSGLEMTWRAVFPALEMTGAASEMRSLWVFAFSPGGASDTHKHSNSTQYTRAWRGRGRLKIGEPESAIEVHLPPQTEGQDSGHQWSIIPSGTFHQAIAGDAGWCVVSFQTVPAEELQDEEYSGATHHYI